MRKKVGKNPWIEWRPMSDRLPCYRLAAVINPADEVDRIARDVFGFKHFTVTQDEDEPIYTARETGSAREMELDAGLGAIWMADWDRLWNPHIKPVLPNKPAATEMAMAFFAEHELLPRPDALPEMKITIKDPLTTNTVRTAPAGSGTVNLDVHVGVPVDIAVAGKKTGRLLGRNKWCVTFGEKGGIINCVLGQLAMQPEVDLEHSPILLPPPLTIRGLESDPDPSVSWSFAYERIRDVNGQQWLLPMYVWTSNSSSEPEYVRFPATERSNAVLNGLTDRARASLQSPLASGQTLADIRKGLLQDQRFAATWTINGSDKQSLRGVQTQGFVDKLRKAPWTAVSFFDEEALEEHWTAKRDEFVQQVDFAYYCGHASQHAWQLSSPAPDGRVHSDEVNDKEHPVQYGGLFVDWIGVAACGPLQDKLVTSKVDDTRAVARWKNAFKGLLGLCGFGTTSVPHQDMGAVLARAMAERSVPKAWFRAGRECQPLDESTENTDGFSIWMGTLTCDDDHPTFDLTLQDGRGGRPRVPPTQVMGMWTPA
jgi:hypothetical protein